VPRFPWSLLLLVAAACQAQSPPGGLEAACARACATRAPACSETQCGRGCNLILDRLAEHEGGHVLACVAASASSGSSCDDRAWARCATRVGTHADGGPPPPAPAPSTVDLGGD
jgi:hypothetical protein